MPPRKRATAGSGKKSNQNQSRDASQPSKFGIQHFFDLHSQSQRTISEKKLTDNGNGNIQTAPKPDDAGASERENHMPVSGILNRGSLGENTASEAKLDNADDRENQLEVSPEPTKSVPVKRLKFSPGMLIKQSQDDAVDEVIWKISPVNDRLHAISKRLPGRVGVLTESSRFNSMNFQPCSQNNVQVSPLKSVKLEKWLSSPPPPKAGKRRPLICSDLVSLGKVNIDCEVSCHGNNGSGDLNDKSEVRGTPTPFTTPPSLTCCSGKHAPDDPRQHKKALIELLDQVEDVIWDEDSFAEDNKTFLDAKRPAKVDLAVKPITREKGEFKRSRGTDCNFLVLEVSEKHGLAESSGPRSSCKVLRLLDEQSGEERVLYLWDEWYFSVVAPGDIVGVIGEFDSQGKCDVNREKNFIIVHPDTLISGTRVSSSFSCPRRAVLDERLKQNEHSIPALMGTLLHQIFQAGLISEFPTKEFLEGYIGTVIEKSVESLYACGVNESDVWKTLTEAIPKMLKWMSSYRYSQASASPTIDFKCDGGLKTIKVSEVIDIEEMAWAPKYGLKGMIDASVRVIMNKSSAGTNEIIMPLEFKTGKGTSGQVAMEHNAQVMLYTLLMSERYMMNIEKGLLYYLHTDQTQGISVKRSDLIGLIMRRNELASDLLKSLTMQQLPAMKQNPNICANCRHLSVCAVYHKVHGGTTAGSGLGDVYDSLVYHLNDTHAAFLKKWERLIDLEAKHVEKDRWSENSRTDHQIHSLSSLVLDASHKSSQKTKVRGQQFVYHFRQQGSPPSLSCSEELHESPMSSSSLYPMLKSGDYVVLSTEPGQQRVANGIVVEVGNSHISISFGKRLRLPGHCSGSMAEILHQQSWRIDKDEATTSFAIMRYNLIQMFLDNENSSRMRKVVVDLKAPRFDSGCIYSQDPSISYVQSEKSLNDDQRRAIIKILTAKDYALILGMPGTGKTSTMVHAVKALLIRGASILLTSYTNSAVDNLLIKLKAQGIEFIRIGRSEAVHEEVKENCISATDTHDIREKLGKIKVVAVTCLGVNSPLLANTRFDVCIMDEAGQIALPVSLGPLMLASKFVLVGDHYQLPPLVQSPEAKENGMSVSLFCRLSEAHPHAISPLHCQYRMCGAVMELSNCLIYGNRLRCGSSEIENAKLTYKCSPSASSWLMEVLDPSQPVVFLNTDFLPAYESNDRRALNNPLEAYITAEVTKGLVARGIEGQDIGIITPYNAQVKLIQEIVSEPVEINTIDKYQGRDKDCIVVSFVRSSENPLSNNTSSLLGDWHRINVALTRAKKKLIMIGSCRTLWRVPLLKLLIEKVEDLNGMLMVSKKDIDCTATILS